MPPSSGRPGEPTIALHAAAPRTVRDAVVAGGAYALLTLVLTWPLAGSLAHQLPADLGDPLLNCWILAWDSEHILRAATGHLDALREYWNANIFYPHPLALAYSEHLTPQALMVLPVYAMSRNPILTYNIAFLLTFLLSALGMFLLVRDLTGSRSAAFLAGVAYGFAPYRFGTLSHLQVLSSMWMPFAMFGFHRYFATRRRTPLVGGTAAWIAQNLSCGYYLLFFTPVLALYLAWELTRRRLWTDRSVVIRMTSAAVVAAIVTAPFLIPYRELRQLGFSARSLAETSRFAADVYGYLTTDVRMGLWGRVVRAWPRSEGSLFPGFAIVLLGAFAVADRWAAARHESSRHASSPAARALASTLLVSCGVLIAILFGWSLHIAVAGVDLKITSLDRVVIVVAALAVALLAASPRARATARVWLSSPVGMLTLVTLFAFAMSLGPEIYSRGRLIEDRNVYSPFHAFVPGFDGLRVPARFAMIVALGLAGLAGCGAAAIVRRRGGVAVVTLATAVVVAESWAVPLPLNENSTAYKQAGLAPLPATLAVGSAVPAVYRFAAELPPPSALIELPFGEVAFDARYMFYSTSHWRRLVNGYSGGSPDEYELWAEQLKDALDAPDAAWRAILATRATHIIVHEAGFAGDRGRRISDWVRAHGAREVALFDADRLFVVTP